MTWGEIQRLAEEYARYYAYAAGYGRVKIYIRWLQRIPKKPMALGRVTSFFGDDNFTVIEISLHKGKFRRMFAADPRIARRILANTIAHELLHDVYPRLSEDAIGKATANLTGVSEWQHELDYREISEKRGINWRKHAKRSDPHKGWITK